jgi:hypothetical protein
VRPGRAGVTPWALAVGSRASLAHGAIGAGRPRSAVAVGAGASVAARGAGSAITRGARSAVTRGAGTSVRAVPTVAIVTAATLATVVVPAVLADELLSDGLEGLVLSKQLEPRGLLPAASPTRDGQDGDALDLEFGFGLDDVTDLRITRQDVAVDHSLGLSGAGGAPRPRAIGARARQLDLDPTGHGLLR